MARKKTQPLSVYANEQEMQKHSPEVLTRTQATISSSLVTSPSSTIAPAVPSKISRPKTKLQQVELRPESPPPEVLARTQATISSPLVTSPSLPSAQAAPLKVSRPKTKLQQVELRPESPPTMLHTTRDVGGSAIHNENKHRAGSHITEQATSSANHQDCNSQSFGSTPIDQSTSPEADVLPTGNSSKCPACGGEFDDQKLDFLSHVKTCDASIRRTIEVDEESELSAAPSESFPVETLPGPYDEEAITLYPHNLRLNRVLEKFGSQGSVTPGTPLELDDAASTGLAQDADGATPALQVVDETSPEAATPLLESGTPRDNDDETCVRLATITDIAEFERAMEGAEHMSYDEVHRRVLNSHRALVAWQDEWLALDAAIKRQELIATEREPEVERKLPKGKSKAKAKIVEAPVKAVHHPRAPKPHLTGVGYQDLIESFSYGYEHNPNPARLGKQDPLEQRYKEGPELRKDTLRERPNKSQRAFEADGSADLEETGRGKRRRIQRVVRDDSVVAGVESAPPSFPPPPVTTRGGKRGGGFFASGKRIGRPPKVQGTLHRGGVSSKDPGPGDDYLSDGEVAPGEGSTMTRDFFGSGVGGPGKSYPGMRPGYAPLDPWDDMTSEVYRKESHSNSSIQSTYELGYHPTYSNKSAPMEEKSATKSEQPRREVGETASSKVMLKRWRDRKAAEARGEEPAGKIGRYAKDQELGLALAGPSPESNNNKRKRAAAGAEVAEEESHGVDIGPPVSKGERVIAAKKKKGKSTLGGPRLKGLTAAQALEKLGRSNAEHESPVKDFAPAPETSRPTSVDTPELETFQPRRTGRVRRPTSSASSYQEMQRRPSKTSVRMDRTPPIMEDDLNETTGTSEPVTKLKSKSKKRSRDEVIVEDQKSGPVMSIEDTTSQEPVPKKPRVGRPPKKAPVAKTIRPPERRLQRATSSLPHTMERRSSRSSAKPSAPVTDDDGALDLIKVRSAPEAKSKSKKRPIAMVQTDQHQEGFTASYDNNNNLSEEPPAKKHKSVGRPKKVTTVAQESTTSLANINPTSIKALKKGGRARKPSSKSQAAALPSPIPADFQFGVPAPPIQPAKLKLKIVRVEELKVDEANLDPEAAEALRKKKAKSEKLSQSMSRRWASGLMEGPSKKRTETLKAKKAAVKGSQQPEPVQPAPQPQSQPQPQPELKQEPVPEPFLMPTPIQEPVLAPAPVLKQEPEAERMVAPPPPAPETLGLPLPAIQPPKKKVRVHRAPVPTPEPTRPRSTRPRRPRGGFGYDGAYDSDSADSASPTSSDTDNSARTSAAPTKLSEYEQFQQLASASHHQSPQKRARRPAALKARESFGRIEDDDEEDADGDDEDDYGEGERDIEEEGAAVEAQFLSEYDRYQAIIASPLTPIRRVRSRKED